jgi:unsaturated chondroitin disaccharide hydrolase
MPNDIFTENLEVCIQKTRRNATALAGDFPRFPHVAHNRGWNTSGDEEWNSLTDGYWTGGFWVGLLWLCHKLTGDAFFKDNARRWLMRLTPRCSSQLIHDVGFLFFPACALGYELSEEEDLKITGKRAAYTLVRIFDKGRGCVPVAERDPYRDVLAVDTMMNLPLLWWAAAEADLEEAGQMAREHVATTAEHRVRPDGSTIHIARLNSDGKLMRVESWQGEGENSCWSRGHAWAVAGAAYALFFTGEESHHALLDKLLNYYLKNRPADGIPYWDYASRDIPDTERDSSAAAIMAHALMLVSNVSMKTRYREIAEGLLAALCEDYTTGVEHPGFLKKVCFHKPAGQDVNCSSVFADFYFMFALYLTTRHGQECFAALSG